MPTDSPSPNQLPLLQRREVEARIAGPLIRAFATEFGEEPTLRLVRAVIGDLARDAGADLAADLGDSTLSAFADGLERWKVGGALEMEVLERSDDRLDFNVTRCRYAEMYRAIGMPELGFSLSCHRDFALIEGFSPDATLVRTQTIMEGAPFCDFRFRRSRPVKGDGYVGAQVDRQG